MTADQKARADKAGELDDDGDAETTGATKVTAAASTAQTDAGQFEITDASAADEPLEADSDDVRTGRAGRIGIAVLAVLLAGAVGLSTWLYFFQYRVDQQTGPAAAATALKAAQDGAVAVLSYSPESLDKDLPNAKSDLTGDFLNYYTNFTNDVVRPAVQQKGVKTEAKVVSSATTASKDRDDPSLAASSVRVTLDRVDGEWLISSFDPV